MLDPTILVPRTTSQGLLTRKLARIGYPPSEPSMAARVENSDSSDDVDATVKRTPLLRLPSTGFHKCGYVFCHDPVGDLRSEGAHLGNCWRAGPRCAPKPSPLVASQGSASSSTVQLSKPDSQDHKIRQVMSSSGSLINPWAPTRVLSVRSNTFRPFLYRHVRYNTLSLSRRMMSR